MLLELATARGSRSRPAGRLWSTRSRVGAADIDARASDYFAATNLMPQMSLKGVRREKAALSSGCKARPATAPAGSNRSRHGGDEMSEAFG